MKVIKLPENGTNFVDYEISGKSIDFGDGEMSFRVDKKERDYEVTIDICQDYTGGLVMGASAGDKYVAQLTIPAREYTETEKEKAAHMDCRYKWTACIGISCRRDFYGTIL